jgi:hypothetical protein
LVVDAAELPSVLSDWTARMYDQHFALHHLDVKSGAWIYRVFLLPSTLLVRQLNVVELLRAFRVVVDSLLREIRSADSELAGRLQEALTYLTESSR